MHEVVWDLEKFFIHYHSFVKLKKRSLLLICHGEIQSTDLEISVLLQIGLFLLVFGWPSVLFLILHSSATLWSTLCLYRVGLPFAFRAALIIFVVLFISYWKLSSEIYGSSLGLSAPHPWYQSPIPPHFKCVVLDLNLITLETIGVQWIYSTPVQEEFILTKRINQLKLLGRLWC